MLPSYEYNATNAAAAESKRAQRAYRRARAHCTERAVVQKPFRFLELPPEIRNRIYDYAFTEDEVLRVSNLGVKSALCVTVPIVDRFTKDVETNQLQYVNKQLRKETKGYGLKCNEICFVTEHTTEPSPLHTCLSFLQTLSTHWLLQIHHIYIRREEDPDYPAGISVDDYYDFTSQPGLFNICRQNPHLTIHWVCPGWILTSAACRFLVDSISIVNSYRGVDLRSQLGMAGFLLNSNRPWCNRSLASQTAPNFRVYPQNVCEPRELFERRVTRTLEDCTVHNPMLGNAQDEVKRHILSWFENGM
jgi:hypothetical protein